MTLFFGGGGRVPQSFFRVPYHERETINLGGIWRNLKLVLYGPLKIKSGSTDNAITNIYMMPPSQCYFYIFLKDSAN